MKRNAMENWLVGFVGEVYVLKFYVAVNRSQGHGTIRLGVFFSFGKDFAGAVEAGDSLGQLGADIHYLEDGGNHEGQEHGVGEVITEGDLVSHLLAGAEPHDG